MEGACLTLDWNLQIFMYALKTLLKGKTRGSTHCIKCSKQFQLEKQRFDLTDLCWTLSNHHHEVRQADTGTFITQVIMICMIESQAALQLDQSEAVLDNTVWYSDMENKAYLYEKGKNN